MKRSTMVILLVLAILLIGAGLVVGNGLGWSYSPVSGAYETLGDYPPGEITAIRAELLSSSVRVYESWSDDVLEVEGSGRAARGVMVVRDGDTLVLSESEPKGMARFFSRDRYNDYVVLWLPEDYAGTLTLSTVSGDVSLGSVDTPMTRVSLSTVSGDADVYDSKLDELSIETVSGDIWADSLKVNRLTLNSVSGDIRGSAKGLQGEAKIEVSTVSGDVSFER